MSLICRLALLFMQVLPVTASAWWNAEWTIRKKITIDTSAAGAAITEPVGTTVVLVRLFDGNFQFAAAREDGSDIRFIAADDKTVLKHHIERYDSLIFEGYAWVRVPDVAANGQITFWLYYGNANAEAAADSKGTYEPETVLVHHFSGTGAPVDASAGGNDAGNAGTPSSGSLIAGGLRLTGGTAVTVPTSPSLAWSEGASLTLSAWVKPTAVEGRTVLFSRRDDGRALIVGLNSGVPFAEVIGAAGTQTASGGEPMAAGAWRHLAVTATGGQVAIYLDGQRTGSVNAALPALNAPLLIGRDADGIDAPGFDGELDELRMTKAVEPLGAIRLAAIGQGTNDKASKLVVVGEDESAEAKAGHGGLMGHIEEFATLIVDISKSLTIEGWVVIFLCTVLAVIGWVVAILKLLYLVKIKRATSTFLRQWEDLSADLTAVDHSDEASIQSMGGKVSGKKQKLMRESPLYHIYHIGSMEIRHRIESAREGFRGLSARSITAIRTTLDGGLTREIQRLNRHLVFLTIGIAGGPYLGLLGTVIGVMITFAVIAKSGEVEVNSIAPGIAGALLATVAGLAVAIPALFAYSYISSQIKDAISDMHVFIDEFMAKMAEFYPTTND